MLFGLFSTSTAEVRHDIRDTSVPVYEAPAENYLDAAVSDDAFTTTNLAGFFCLVVFEK